MHHILFPVQQQDNRNRRFFLTFQAPQRRDHDVTRNFLAFRGNLIFY